MMTRLYGTVVLGIALALAPVAPASARTGTEVPEPAPTDAMDPTAEPTAAESTASPSQNIPAPVPAAVPAPPKPGFSGRGLLISAYAVTGFSWLSRLVGMGLGLSTPATCDASGDCNFGRLQASLAFTYLAPISQLAATGLVIPGGVLKGRTDGWSYITTGKPDRKGRSLLVAGAVLFGVFTAASIALRPGVLLGCLSNVRGCGGQGAYVGYMLGVQASDTLSTAGAGLMSYGVAYQNYRKTHAPRVAFGPWSHRGAYGLSLHGDF